MIDLSEFLLSLMGKSAMNFGALADLETLNELLKSTDGVLAGLSADLEESRMTTTERAARNAELRERLKGMKKDMGHQHQQNQMFF
jgi:hypothetical protein